MNKDSLENDRRKRNNLLSQYYGMGEEKDADNLLDVDGKQFNAEVFVDKLVKVTHILISFLCAYITHFLIP